MHEAAYLNISAASPHIICINEYLSFLCHV